MTKFLPPRMGVSPEMEKLLSNPHWAMVYDTLGNAQPFGPGCFFYLVADPARDDRTIPLIVSYMSAHTFHARCACGQEECNRQAKFSISWEGKHPFKFKQPEDEQ